eukprot:TRINITY_DN8631_c0_g1_i1.p1 TRINITY_DN8631_c0_g1~~TRINITY_DN8631_c0_g1_i1.p1  ORF type:complete len:497 (-),score=122.32 TRINITY_DN8631_c0_g1_i1:43-1533(-)
MVQIVIDRVKRFSVFITEGSVSLLNNMKHFILLVLFVSVAVSTNRVHSDHTKSVLNHLSSLNEQQFRQFICPQMEKSAKNSFYGLKCSPESEEEKTLLARNYINKYGKPEQASLSPVVLLPGLGGSAIEASISKDKAPHWWCWSEWEEWFRVWLPINELINQDCWFDNLQVLYDAGNDTYANYPGVTTRVKDFGGLSGIDYLDYWFGYPLSFTSYYSSLIASLKSVGYVEGTNLFGAPFDWRFPSTKLNSFYHDIAALIEKAYTTNGNKKVTVVAHSMGCPTVLAFLKGQDQAWKDKYIASFVPIAGPWAGSAQALKTVISGDNFGIEVLGYNLLSLQDVSRLAKQSGGIVELIPHPRYYKSDTVFVRHQGVSYTANDFDKLFNDIGSPITTTIHQRTEVADEELPAPSVPTHCLYGFGLETELQFNYVNGWTNDPEISYDSQGDGVVPLASLQGCKEWEGKQSQPITIKEFNLRGHNDILEDQEVFDYIINILTQ